MPPYQAPPWRCEAGILCDVGDQSTATLLGSASMRSLLPAVLPARTVNTSQTLFVSNNSSPAIATHLFIDPLPTILALAGILDDWIMRHKRVYQRQAVQRKPHHDKGDDLVDELAVGHDDGAIVESLAEGIIPRAGIVIGARP